MNVEKLIKVIGVLSVTESNAHKFWSNFSESVGCLWTNNRCRRLSSILHPWPEGFSGTSAEINLHVQNYPSCDKVDRSLINPTFVATRFGHKRNPLHGYGVGFLLVVLAVFNMILLPYPSWFWFLNLTVLPAAAFCGTSWANKV